MTRSILFLALFLTACAESATYDVADIQADSVAIRAVLDTQVEAWNTGDKAAFMEGYLKSDSLRFASAATVHYGWQTTLDRYHAAYPDRAAMGTLAFDDLDIRILSPDYALVFGRWGLEREADAPGGLFTLLFQKAESGWVIVHDHTSS